MKERTLEQKLTKTIQEMGGLALKFHSVYNTGYPDRIIIMPGGQIYFVEVKAPGKKPTPKQQIVHDALRGMDCEVHVVDSLETLDAFISRTIVLKHFPLQP